MRIIQTTRNIRVINFTFSLQVYKLDMASQTKLLIFGRFTIHVSIYSLYNICLRCPPAEEKWLCGPWSNKWMISNYLAMVPTIHYANKLDNNVVPQIALMSYWITLNSKVIILGTTCSVYLNVPVWHLYSYIYIYLYIHIFTSIHDILNQLANRATYFDATMKVGCELHPVNDHT